MKINLPTAPRPVVMGKVLKVLTKNKMKIESYDYENVNNLRTERSPWRRKLRLTQVLAYEGVLGPTAVMNVN